MKYQGRQKQVLWMRQQ